MKSLSQEIGKKKRKGRKKFEKSQKDVRCKIFRYRKIEIDIIDNIYIYIIHISEI